MLIAAILSWSIPSNISLIYCWPFLIVSLTGSSFRFFRVVSMNPVLWESDSFASSSTLLLATDGVLLRLFISWIKATPDFKQIDSLICKLHRYESQCYCVIKSGCTNESSELNTHTSVDRYYQNKINKGIRDT